MRSPQSKLIALIALWATILLFQMVWMSEGWRLAYGEDRLEQVQIGRGAQLYSENCVICHGPAGEGVVGPPLLRPEWREGTDIELEAIADMITKTLQRGRGGTASPTWVHNPDGTIESFTAMPVFGKGDGGPLNEQQIEDLVVFLMKGDFGKVRVPSANIRKRVVDPATGESVEVNVEATDLPEAVGVSQEINDQGRQLMIDRGCLSCHTIGEYGGVVGPNLTDVGDWTTLEFLRAWLTAPEEMANRMPSVWWGDNEPKEIVADWDGIHRTQMPNPLTQLGATPEQVEIMAQYLSGLRRN